MTIARAWIMLATLVCLVGPAFSGTISGKVTGTGLNSNSNAVVYIEKIAGQTFKAPEKHAVMDQKGKEFIPRILPVLMGTTVDFVNSDPFMHTVYTPEGCGDNFNLGNLVAGATASHTFAQPCAAALLLCEAHPEMVAYVVVVETPYFAVTDADGKYTISDAPNGTYQLSVWHERLKKKQTQEITVNSTATADFTLNQ
jgi:plastocyanin